MRGAGTDFDKKRQIYSNPTNAAESLQSLSTAAQSRWMDTNPLFHIYRHAFTQLGAQQEHDTLGNFDGAPAQEYADRLVQDLFDLQIEHIEADGALVYNVLMTYWGLLSDVAETCRTYQEHKDGDAAQNKMHRLLDEAAALWVGEGQIRGQSGTGYMMYSMAQEVGERFNQDDEGTEVHINLLVLETLTRIQQKINRNECASGVEAYVSMRREIRSLIQYSNTVIIQQILHYVQENNAKEADYVEMYALALIPQIAVCDQTAYNDILRVAVASSITAETKAVLINALQSSYSCLLTDCKTVGEYLGGLIPQCDDNDPNLPAMAGYQPSVDVRSVARMDRDLAYINIFLEWEVFNLAQDFYVYGWSTGNNLQDLALTLAQTNGVDPIALYLSFYSNEWYTPDNMVMNALEKKDSFSSAYPAQRGATVSGVLQGTVMYWAVVEKMKRSVEACSGGQLDEARLYWDSAVAYYVGSIEGAFQTGQHGGQFLFSLSKDMCEPFGTCEPDSSMEGTETMASFNTGVGLLSQSNCPELESLSTTITNQLLEPLIQAMLFSSSRITDTKLETIGSLLSFSRPVVPAVDKVSPTNAATINKNSNYFFASSTSTNIDEFFEAVVNGLQAMPVECADIGDLQASGFTRGFCPGDAKMPTPTTPAPVTQPGSAPKSPTVAPTDAPIYIPEPHAEGIAWGRYGFTDESIAENDSRFSLDVKAMYHAATPALAGQYYNQTTSANVPNGMENGLRSLQELSTLVSGLMSEDAMYAFYRVALYEDESFDDQSYAEGWPYADSVVKLALSPENGNDQKLASEAAVVMNVWMMIVHRLYGAARDCKKGLKSTHLVDSAVGLWIGQEQGMGKYNSGWMIYSVAQTAAQNYGMPEQEAEINGELMDLFNMAKNNANACEINDGMKYLELRFTVDAIIRKLSVPLLQNLLYYMSVDDYEFVELYSLAFIPQAVSCNEGSYSNLKDALFEGYVRDTTVDDDLKEELGQVLSCLRFTCQDLGDVAYANEYLKALVDDLCFRIEGFGGETPLLGGYQLSNNVNGLDRIDLDIHQMDLFMRVKAYDLATDVYEYGRNSYWGVGASNTLKEFVDAMPDLETEDMFQLYRAYFSTPQYAQQNIIEALGKGGDGRFSGASRRQLSEVVLRTFQVMVSYMHVVGRLRQALSICEASKTGQAEVDEAVALFVGSMEGRAAGGDSTKNGKMMFALAKEVCKTFDRCESHGDATSNEFLMFAFDDMKQYFDSGECDRARSVLEGSILPMLKVPLIQGTLYFAFQNSGLSAQSDEASLASGDILAGSIVPLVNQVNKTSASIIVENMEYNRAMQPVPSGLEAVFRAFGTAVRGMDVDCDNIGTLGGHSTCTGSVDEAPLPQTPTNLGDDLYVTTTYVQDRANIAIDIKDMQDLIASGTEDQAELIYEEGRNSVVYDQNGKRLGLRSLAGFSTNADGSNPLYTMAVYALADENGKYLGKDAWRYADTIVKEALADKSPVAAEAAVALNVWMELAKELHDTVTRCKEREIKDEDGVHSIDEAAAYWIGDGQTAGDENGHLLYALAEKMGKHFGLDESGQSRTNVNILRLFHQAAIELSLPNACSESPTTAKRVRHIIEKITSQMIAVNIQALVHSLRTDDRDRVRVYTHAVVPLTVSCSLDTYTFLQEKLIDAPYKAEDVETIIQTIYSTLQCFGLQCDDIGMHELEMERSCRDPRPLTSLAGYTPNVDVREYADIDLDILEMSILMEMGAYDAALDLYSYGKHAATGFDENRAALSLHQLASSSGRSVVPQFDAFRRYFNGDEKYADTLIQSLYTEGELYGNERQRRLVWRGICRYMIMYMASLQALNEAVESCQDNADDTRSAMQYWDIGAAFMIGYLEGEGDRGSGEGLLFWGLANEKCAEFGTCSEQIPGSSIINDQIATLLYAGRGAILAKNCGEVRKSAREIQPLLTTSLIQGGLSSTSKLSRRNVVDKDLVQAEAYTFALSVLPLIADVDRDSANVISGKLKIDGTTMQTGFDQVVRAFSRPLDMIGVDCENVGASSEIDACTGVVYSSDSNKAGIVVSGVVIGTLAAVVMIIIFRRRRRNAKKASGGETVEFVPPKGELNHTSDVLPDQSSRQADSDTNFLTGNDADAALSDEDDDAFLENVATPLETSSDSDIV